MTSSVFAKRSSLCSWPLPATPRSRWQGFPVGPRHSPSSSCTWPGRWADSCVACLPLGHRLRPARWERRSAVQPKYTGHMVYNRRKNPRAEPNSRPRRPVRYPNRRSTAEPMHGRGYMTDADSNEVPGQSANISPKSVIVYGVAGAPHGGVLSANNFRDIRCTIQVFTGVRERVGSRRPPPCSVGNSAQNPAFARVDGALVGFSGA